MRDVRGLNGGVPAVYMRGGTSKGVFLHAADVPPPGAARDELLLRIMGSPDPMQLDGMGGTFSSTSKVVVVEPGADGSIVYWFAQIGTDRPIVDWSGNCGNLTTAVAPFAVDEGMVDVSGDSAQLRLLNGNTGVAIEATVQLEGGRVKTSGDCVVAGVPGSGAPVVTRYLEPIGGVLGALLPTGRASQRVETPLGSFDVSIVDASHPNVFVDAAELGLQGDRRNPTELNRDAGLLAVVEAIRAASAVLVGAAGTVEEATERAPAIPRIVLIRPGLGTEDLRVTAFSMGAVHRALPMTGALCVAAACHIPGTVAAAMAPNAGAAVRIRHPKGVTEVLVELQEGEGSIRSLGIVRTARRLMDGIVYPRDY